MLSAGLLYCMEYLERNMDWLQERMSPLIEGKTVCWYMCAFFDNAVDHWSPHEGSGSCLTPAAEDHLHR